MSPDNIEKIRSYFQPGKHIHLVGIGGVSMRPLGLVLRGMGMNISGSDMNSSVSTDELIAGDPGLYRPQRGQYSRR